MMRSELEKMKVTQVAVPLLNLILALYMYLRNELKSTTCTRNYDHTCRDVCINFSSCREH